MRAGFLLLLVLLAGCDEELPVPPVFSRPAQAQAVSGLVHHDLVGELPLAQVRHFGALVVDFGTPAARPYSLGGWGGVGGTRGVDQGVAVERLGTGFVGHRASDFRSLSTRWSWQSVF
jgi:hypothetical protein